jgi:hypothetical protein
MNHFEQYGYIVLHDFFSEDELANMHDELGVTNPEIIELATKRLEGLLDTKLLINHQVRRVYTKDDEVEYHVNRAACQYALTFTVSQSGDHWPIVFRAVKGDKVVDTKPGTAVLYCANWLPHWRPDNNTDKQVQGYMYWNDLNTELGSFMQHFELEQRLDVISFDEFKEEGKLPVCHSHV